MKKISREWFEVPRTTDLRNYQTLGNAMKIQDVTKCLEEFDLLGKAYGKAKTLRIRKVTQFYIHILADLGYYLDEFWKDKEWKNKMNKNSAKVLSTLLQKIQKHTKILSPILQISITLNTLQMKMLRRKNSKGFSDGNEDGVSAAAFF